MPYAWVFVVSYALAFVVVLLWARAIVARTTPRFRANEPCDARAANFERHNLPPPALLVVPTLLFGTFLGGWGALCYTLFVAC
jgi:RsiW-degrading membrane proteinase PrsW (M82 family)